MRVISFHLIPSMESLAGREPTLIIRLSVGMDIAWDMLPYPSARRSVVTHAAFFDATARFGQPGKQDRGLPLRDLRIFGDPVPDLTVIPSRAPARLNVDGFLDLDFFSQFEVVEWHPKSHLTRLTIE